MANEILSKVDYGNAVDNLCKVDRSFGISEDTAHAKTYEREKYE